jgi:hypothetical protein
MPTQVSVGLQTIEQQRYNHCLMPTIHRPATSQAYTASAALHSDTSPKKPLDLGGEICKSFLALCNRS